MADIDLFDNWFRVADKDRDGVISGMEAVEFFQRSQLPQGTLFKVSLRPRALLLQVSLALTAGLALDCCVVITMLVQSNRSGTWWRGRVHRSTSHNSTALYG